MPEPPAHRPGFVVDGVPDTPHLAAVLHAGPEGIQLEVPLLEGVTDDHIKWFKDPTTIPDHLQFIDMHGSTSLSGFRSRSSSRDLLRGTWLGTVEVSYFAMTGHRQPDYSEIHGLSSEIAGLPTWLEPDVFSDDTETDDAGRLQAATFRVESRPDVTVPGVAGLLLSPHWHTEHDYANGSHTMRETVRVETRFEEPLPWTEHLRVHRSIQDLIALAFWHPTNLVVHSALRVDDPATTLDGTEWGEQWQTAIAPHSGRRSKSSPVRPLTKNARPLFYFDDIGADGVATWMREYDALGQAMWVLSSSLFRGGGTVEVQLLQVGTALEALGREVALRSGRLEEGKFDKTFQFETALIEVGEDTDCSLDKVLAGLTDIEAWAKAFNTTYKGVKHADNALPNPNEAYLRGEQGALLARLWLARHLGADRSQLESRLH